MKKVFIFFIFSFLQQVVAQQIPAEYQLSPAGLLETNFDHYGTSYPLVNLQIGATTNYTVVQAGIFDIYYATNSGMEGTSTANSQKRNVINKVFSDLSDFLDTPLKTIPNAPKIKIWIQNFTAVQSHAYNDIAYGTSFYNVPKNMGTAAIADNQLWQMINSGKDPYHKVTFSVDDSNQPLSFFHAAFAFNPALNWNTSLGYAPYANQYDLYTFALREAVHALGVNSLIAQNGTSRFGANYNYYSRFDTFLKNKNNVALIANTQGCSFNSGYGFNGNLSDLGTNCNNNNNASPCGKTNYFAGTNTLKLVTPNCYNPLVTSLFVNTNCNENLDNNWLLDRALRKGDMQRYLNPYERQLLVDLGYGFARTFGKNSRLNHINYNRTATSHAVVGVNDGFDTLGAMRYAATNQPLAVVNLLANDKNATNFECLQDLTDATAVFSATTGTASTSSMFTTAVAGNHLLSYIPYNANTGKRGNRTYVYVYVLKAECPVTPDPCNLVVNGGFEIFIGDPPNELSQFESKVCQWRENAIATPDYYRTNSLDPIAAIPNNFFGTQNTNPNPNINNGINNAYSGIINQPIRDYRNNRYKEILSGNLAVPLAVNRDYQLTFDVSLSESNNNLINEIQVLLTQNTPVLPGAIGNIPTVANSILLDNNNQISDTQNWTPITFNFNSGMGGHQFIHIGALRDPLTQNLTGQLGVNQSYYYIDNVILREVNNFNPILNIQPESLCITAPSLDLSTMLTGGVTDGVFSGPGVTGTTFTPATAGVGTHTITYTIPSPIACPAIVVTDTITVNSCLPAQKPYISQVYASATNDKFVEVKNKDNTTAIGSGQYFLALYANGAPTTGAPTSFVDLGAIPANGVKVFRANLATTPAYAVTGATSFNLLENYTGTNDLLLITTSTGTNAYNDRIDIIGDNTTHSVFAKDYTQETYASLVRVSCTPMGFPRVDYDEQDWVGFSDSEVGVSNSLTNGELGRHWSETLVWQITNTWNDLGIIDSSPAINESNPDRSREIKLNKDYNTATYGSFEACSLNITSFVTLTITSSNYVSVQTKVDIDNDGNLIIQSEGSLVMVRDCYYQSSCDTQAGLDLVNLGANSTMNATKQTVALNGPYDYVYLSSPLSLNTANPKLNQIFNFGSGTGPVFNPNRFYLFQNKSFCDIYKRFLGIVGDTDGYDDNYDDYDPRDTPAEQNANMIPGRGYATWPPVPATAGNYNYNITFSGEMNNGLVTTPVFKNNSKLGRNSNLVGNPYPSAIDLDKFFNDNITLIEPIAYIWTRGTTPDDPNSTYEGPNGLNYTAANFSVYTPDVSLNTENNPSFFGGSNIIASGQSFFVRTYKDFTGFTNVVGAEEAPMTPATIHPQEEVVTVGDLRFRNFMRTTAPNITFSKASSGIENETARSTTASTHDKIWVNLTDANNYTAQLGLYFKPTGTALYNPREDAATIAGRKYNFYTQSTDEDLLIDVQDAFSTDKIIPLGITNITGQNQTFTISIPRKEGVFASQNVYLEDTQLGIIHNLSQNNYTFTTNESIIEGRFELRFNDNNIVTNRTAKIIDNQIVIKTTTNEVAIQSLDKNIQSVYVSDIYTPSTSGVLVAKSEKINSKQIVLNVGEKYRLLTVKIILEDGSVVSKKILR